MASSTVQLWVQVNDVLQLAQKFAKEGCRKMWSLVYRVLTTNVYRLATYKDRIYP